MISLCAVKGVKRSSHPSSALRKISMDHLTEVEQYLYNLQPSKIVLGLDTSIRLMDALGHPHERSPVIHIAGTNGKGSVAAMTDSILQQSGMKVGLYTSPHLLEFNERIRINGAPITTRELEEVVSEVRQAAEEQKIKPTFFEFTTAVAFLHMARKNTDINVIEVGLGGRLDATNVCKAMVSIITSIGRDHTRYLGDDLKNIAFEKASIIKTKGTVLAHIEIDEIYEVIEQFALEQTASIRRLGRDFFCQTTRSNRKSQSVTFQNSSHTFSDLELPLLGSHQAANAGLAIQACIDWAEKTKQNMPENWVRNGLKNVKWPGRMEIVLEQPLIVLDCAHNTEGVKKLTQTLDEYFPGEKKWVIFGALNDKPYLEMVAHLRGWADQLILTRPNSDRSQCPHEIMEKSGENPEKPVQIIEKTAKALEILKNKASSDDIVCVTGSLYTVAEAKQYIDQIPKIHLSSMGSSDSPSSTVG